MSPYMVHNTSQVSAVINLQQIYYFNKGKVKLGWIIWKIYADLYEGWNFNSGNYLFTTDTK